MIVNLCACGSSGSKLLSFLLTPPPKNACGDELFLFNHLETYGLDPNTLCCWVEDSRGFLELVIHFESYDYCSDKFCSLNLSREPHYLPQFLMQKELDTEPVAEMCKILDQKLLINQSDASFPRLRSKTQNKIRQKNIPVGNPQ